MIIEIPMIVGILLGAPLGIVIFIWAAITISNRDNKKFDSDSKPTAEHWPESNGGSSWSSKVTVTIPRPSAVGKKEKKKEKSLEDQLNEALEKEEYEKAAELRDKINKQTKNK